MHLITLGKLFYHFGKSGILAKYLIITEDSHLLGNFLVYLKTPNIGPYRSGGGTIFGVGGGDDLFRPVFSIIFWKHSIF